MATDISIGNVNVGENVRLLNSTIFFNHEEHKGYSQRNIKGEKIENQGNSQRNTKRRTEFMKMVLT
jgi:hypothetical protein